MTASLHANDARARLFRSIGADRGPGRLWRFTDEGMTAESVDMAGDIVAVPTEAVAVKIVALPLPTLRQRIAALPFALEDQIAEPLGGVHLALGRETRPQHFLVGVVDHDHMRRWQAATVVAGIERAVLVPDALLLPTPPADTWRVHIEDARALVRESDGAGFAMAVADLPKAWTLAGQPPCHLSGDPAPSAMAIGATPAPVEESIERTPALNLAQGPYATRRSLRVPTVGRRLAAVAAAGLAAHAAIAIADTAVLERIADQRALETRTLASSVLPMLGPDEDLVSAVATRLPLPASGSADGFVDLLDRVSAALAPVGNVGVRAMRFDGASQTMILGVPAGREAQYATALTASGLTVASAPGRLSVRKRL